MDEALRRLAVEYVGIGMLRKGEQNIGKVKYRLQVYVEPNKPDEEKKPSLFLIDSGAETDLMDTETANASTKTHRDERTVIKGIQGKVDQASRAERIFLVFAGFRQDHPNLITINLGKMGDSIGVAFGGILGIPLLSAMKVSIDYHDGTVSFNYRK